MVHIVQALVSLNLGGSELVAVELGEHGIRTGHRATVIAADGPLGERARSAGVEHIDWPIGRKRLSTLGYIQRLRAWIEDEQPDVLHVHSRLPAWICHFALRKMDAESRPLFVTSMHGQYTVSRYSRVMASGDRVIAVSDHIRDYTLRNYPNAAPERIFTVPGGISHADFPFGHQPGSEWYEETYTEFPELRGKRLLCLPGRLSRYKGHRDFVEMLGPVLEQEPDVHGVFVGQARAGSKYHSELEQLARKRNLWDRITITGGRTDMRDWMAASSIVFSLCADPPEAFGRTVPEALHLGTPVIGWDHGGVSETLAVLFPHGAVTPGDKPALLERSLEFLRDPPAVERNTAFGLAESMNMTMDVYREGLEDKAGRSS